MLQNYPTNKIYINTGRKNIDTKVYNEISSTKLLSSPGLDQLTAWSKHGDYFCKFSLN